MKKAKVVLAVVAHPDDVEFGCGGTMAKLSSEGAKLYFVICTAGNRGSRSHSFKPEELIDSRKKEQLQAAKVLGAEEVFFLDHEDGNLEANIKFKEEIVRLVRKLKPDMIFTHDPTWYYRVDKNGAYVNHNDHRETGKAVLDAVYPLSRDLLSFPHHQDEGLTPHKAEELYLFFSEKANHFIDITKFIDQKISSIEAHKSQIDDPKEMENRVKKRASELGKKIKVKYAEGFTKLVFN